MKSPLPIIGQTYDYFDDGKIKKSRRLKVTITKIAPYDEVDGDILDAWKNEVIECDWLYAPKTDYFIFGDLDIGNYNREVCFVRTVDDDWFSMGWWGGSLDVDGSLYKMAYDTNITPETLNEVDKKIDEVLIKDFE